MFQGGIFMDLKKSILATITASLIVSSGISYPGLLDVESAGADTLSYPVQEFRFGIGDTDRSITLSGTDGGDYLSSYTFLGERKQKWYLNYISAGVYEIVSSETGYVVTNDNGLAVIAPDVDGANQRWNITSVENDFEGYALYYKVTSNADNSVGLTFDADSNSFSVDTYTGDMYQKFRLNLDGLEGFAGESCINGKMKAGTIGGLLGEPVFCDTVEKVVAALDSTEPKTVVITKNLDFVNQAKDKQRIRDDKTLVGSYAANTITDCLLRNDDFWGKDARPSQNIVIRNMHFHGKYLNSSGSGQLLLQFYGVRNLWLDHNSFDAEFAQNKDNEVGKFVWINTPANGWSDDKYNGYNPDYITASYNNFLNRYWTFAFGSQNKDTSRLHTTLMFNKWEQCSRRCPQYSNGYDHNYNNYHTVTNGSNPNKSSQVIGGEGSRVINENCLFEGYKGNELDPDRNSCLSFTDSGSYTADSPSSTPAPISFKNHNSDSWKVGDCYGYHLIAAYNGGNGLKSFCNTYSGSWNAYSKIRYITDADCADYVQKTVAQPNLKSVEVGNEPVGGGKTGTEFNTQLNYMIINKGSGLSLNFAENSGVQGEKKTLFVLSGGENGYYRIIEKTSGLALTIQGNNNGTALTLAAPDGTDSQLFKLVQNEDASFTICTKGTRDKSCIGIAAGSKSSGAAAVLWSFDESDNQKWTVEANFDPIKGKLITLTPKDMNYYTGWGLADSLQIGSTVFGDRNVTYAEIPESLLGSEYVQTACDSKNTVNDLAEIYANEAVTLYAAFDARVEKAPKWLAEWTKTDLTVKNSNEVVFELYSLSLDAGDTVILGSNGQSSGCVNYTVFAVPADEKIIKGDVNMDGELNVADVVLLQKWLLAVPNTHLANWKAADLCEDGRLDVFDLCLMKRLLLMNGGLYEYN